VFSHLTCTLKNTNDFLVTVKLPSVNNLNIVILGNSITGAPLDTQVWNYGWGLSASSPEKDYVHLLYQDFVQYLGYSPYFKTLKMYDFEQNFLNFDYKRLYFIDTIKPQIIILRFGDNIDGTAAVSDHLWKSFDLLLKTLKPKTDVVICTSRWYPNKTVDAIMRHCCIENGISFIDISYLYNDKRNLASSEREFSDKDWGTHPGDRGMEEIAAILWNHIRQILD
jgi:hypothetical protein